MSPITHPSIEEWLAELEQRGKSAATIATYRQGLSHFVRWSEQSYGKPFDPAEIISRDIEDWKAFQQTIEKAAPTTFNSRRTALSRYFQWAVRRGMARKNPVETVPSIRLEPSRPKALDRKYVRRLLRHVHKTGQLRDIAMVELLLGAGLRVSELLALQTGDVSFNQHRGQVVVRRGKGAVHRTVPLTGKVRRALKAYLEEELTRLAFVADHPELDDRTPLWIGERGPLKDRSGIFYLLKRLARNAGLDPDLISPHVLRHTLATRYLEAHPEALREVAAILGHSNLATTMRYTVPSEETLTTRMEEAELRLDPPDHSAESS